MRRRLIRGWEGVEGRGGWGGGEAEEWGVGVGGVRGG